ncbi:MAG: primosomal protein N' [Alcanivorax sp.]|nr:primosomal protein N' [Alcanivorax sp.]MAY09822.1 primosomal protein N' [Alcanivorax sp.]MBI55911.1 primosomal protein N' [Alcanivorax sp.]HCE38581.1 primosomal protein N' [Alcanivorax sp.]
MPSPSVVQVALPVPLPGCFDYRLPPGAPAPDRGCRVEVPFGRRTLVGLVHDHQPSELKQLKTVKRVLDEEPVIDPALYALCERAARYYHHPLGEVLNFVLPALLRQGQPARAGGEVRWRLTDRGHHVAPERLARAPRQLQALEILAEHPRGLTPAMLEALSVSRPALQALRDKEWVERVEVAETPPPEVDKVRAEPALRANAEQRAAIEAIAGAEGFQPFLLDGVTGSGKTEVYLQAMAPVLAAGKQVLVLVPEIGLTPQTLRRFRQRFAVPVTVLHSGLTDRERLDAWVAAREGHARILIGTRSAVFTPLARPGLIIVDEAHDASLKQQDGFRYHARDLASWRAQQLGVPVVHGSATPALETLQLARDGRYHWLRLRQRAGGAGAPPIELLDARDATPDRPLLPTALKAITDTLGRGEQALVFLNRRGFAPVILCRDCGWQDECPRCDSLMTWHRSEHQLRCHHCGHQHRVPRHCGQCGSTNLTDAGAGTEKLETLLADHCDAPVVRIDRDTTRRKGSLDAKLAQIQKGEPAVLVGTQMLAKGHHFPRLSLAVIMNMDAGFLSADFRGPEQAAQLLLQVAGRSGRQDRPGRVLMQSRHGDHNLVRLAAAGDYHALANTLLEERRAAGLPPFGHLALLRCEAMAMDQAMAFLEECAGQLPEVEGAHVLGPVPAPMEKRAGRYRAQLLVQSAGRPALHGLLDALMPLARSLPSGRRCRWHLDVDPIDLL